MSDPVRQLSFSGGEIAPAMWARTDHVKYDTGLRTLRNMVCMRHGGVTGRPGTQYIGTTLNGGNPVRLIPFIFNETGDGQSYVLEFGNLYIAFYQNGGVVSASPPAPYTVVSPYLQADLATLQFAQSADVLTIVHPSYRPRELSRNSATNWSLDTIVFAPSIDISGDVEWTGTAPGTAAVVDYGVVAVAASGEESFISTNIVNGQYVAASPATPVTITWDPVVGAVYYKVFICDSTNTLTHLPLGNWGFLGTATGLFFLDNGITPDYTVAPIIDDPVTNDLFDSTDNYPSTVGYTQQRRCFANTNTNPIGFWMSQPGSFSNFTIHPFQQDSDAIYSSLFSQEVNAIEHVLELKFMLMLTAGAEIYVQGNGSGVVVPGGINASTQSQYGASPLIPLKVGDVLIFNQALGSFIRDFSFDFAIDGYRGNDITVFSSHLFEGYQITDWGFQKVPDSVIWAVRNDGVLLSCTYIREQQVLAWAHHDFTNGTVENVCVIPENGEYAVYLSIAREINGSTVRYIERMSSRVWTDPIDATYLDCFLSYDGRNETAITMTLSAPSGTFLDTSEAYTQQLTLTTSAGFFTSAMVDDEIFIQDDEFVESQGASGNQIRCTIQAFTSTTIVTVTPSSLVPAEFQNAATSNWSRAVQTVSGLSHLEGEEVSVWADRFLVGSPLNTNVTSVYTVSGGSITLDKCYAVIYVGLPMIQDVQPLDLEQAAGASMLAKRKMTGKINIYTYKSRTMFAGSENPDENSENTEDDALYGLIEQMQGENRKTYNEPPNLQTGQDFITFDTNWNYGGRLFIRNVDPVPFSILSFAPEGIDPSQNPMVKKV